MVFGWFSKGKGTEGKLAKAKKVQAQARWAEALALFEEALEAEPEADEARDGARSCRERLVQLNLEEARAFAAADLEKAREHARLAFDLADGEELLRKEARGLLEELRAAEPAPAPPKRQQPERLFAPSCSCATPCRPDETEEVAEDESDWEDLFGFYLEGMEESEREAFEREGPAFREGFVLLQQGHCAEARPLLEKSAAGGTDSPVPSYALGLLAGFEGDAAGAERSYRASLAMDPTFGPSARHLAQLFRDTKRQTEALAVLEQHLSSFPEDAEARALAASCHLDLGDHASAAREAEEAHRLGAPEDIGPALLLSQAYRAGGDLEQALQVLQGVLARKPDQVQALAAAGDILLEQGGARAERAAELFKRCYRNDPEQGWVYLLKVALAYASLGRLNEAQELVERAGGELPEDEEARRAWEEVRGRITET